MILYILKFSACLTAFILFYKLFLEKENMHVFKRFYLLSALLFSVGIPLVTFTYYVEASTEIIPQIIENITIKGTPLTLKPQTNYTSIILGSIYGIGLLLFGLKFIRNLFIIINKTQP